MFATQSVPQTHADGFYAVREEVYRVEMSA